MSAPVVVLGSPRSNAPLGEVRDRNRAYSTQGLFWYLALGPVKAPGIGCRTSTASCAVLTAGVESGSREQVVATMDQFSRHDVADSCNKEEQDG